MGKILIEVEDGYSEFVIGLLSNLKQNIIKDIIVEKNNKLEATKLLNEFKKLKNNSKNKIVFTKNVAINTDDMIKDDIF